MDSVYNCHNGGIIITNLHLGLVADLLTDKHTAEESEFESRKE
jgi:hypothetical protein